MTVLSDEKLTFFSPLFIFLSDYFFLDYIAALARNEQLQENLWEFSEDIVREKVKA